MDIISKCDVRCNELLSQLSATRMGNSGRLQQQLQKLQQQREKLSTMAPPARLQLVLECLSNLDCVAAYAELVGELEEMQLPAALSRAVATAVEQPVVSSSFRFTVDSSALLAIVDALGSICNDTSTIEKLGAEKPDQNDARLVRSVAMQSIPACVQNAEQFPHAQEPPPVIVPLQVAVRKLIALFPPASLA